MKRNFPILLSLSLIVACDQHTETKTRISKLLLDPQSAQWRNLEYFEIGTDKFTCGEINAKNAYGGYTGFNKFMVRNGDRYLAENELDGVLINTCCMIVKNSITLKNNPYYKKQSLENSCDSLKKVESWK